MMEGTWDSLFSLIGTVYLVLLWISGVLFVGSTVMIELIEHEEAGEGLSLFRALKETFTDNLLAVFLIGVVYSVLWFILLILEAMTSSDKGDKGSNFIDYIEKLVRMMFFLSLPAIAWEGKGPIGALRKGWNIFKTHTSTFAGTYVTSFVTALLIIVPLLIMEYVFGVSLKKAPLSVQVICVFYGGLVWSFGIYLEQMSAGLLYLWHRKWEDAGGEGELSDFKRPSLLDDVNELTKLRD
jgi:hypothetical protein